MPLARLAATGSALALLLVTPPSGRAVLAAGEGLNEPFGVSFDAAGNVYVVEMGGNRVSVLGRDGKPRVLAGTGEKGLAGADGHLYVADTFNNCVRRIDLKARAVTRVAGTGEKGFSGDGGPAREARLRGPKHISVDGRDDVLISDTENHVIRLYSPRDGTIRRVAGTGEKGAAGLGGPPEACQLDRPHGAVVQPGTGAIYVSDSENHRVIRIER